MLTRLVFLISAALALFGVISAVRLTRAQGEKPPAPPPVAEPARSTFARSVAATGIIEAANENVNVATTRPGVVAKVFVKVGSEVKKGDPLFQIDDREAQAHLQTLEAQKSVQRAALEAEKVMVADARDQWDRMEQLQKQRVASADEAKRKEFQLQNWTARVARLEADLAAAEAQLKAAGTDLEILTVRASRDGQILRLNVREGEYAAASPVEPLMVLGDVMTLQVRADVDEQNAPQVEPDRAAQAFLKGTTSDPIPLRFVRIDPFVIPKRSLTGDSTERVDTRVLQIVFSFEVPKNRRLYVGQQVDVFIERSAPAEVRTTAESQVKP